MSDPHDSELLNIFWVEVGEYLQKLNNLLLQTEASAQANPESLREMNRYAHSMKGAARAVGIGVVETLGHYLEDIFGATLKGELTLEPSVCDLLYDTLDLIQNVMNGAENHADTLATTVARLEQLIATEAPAPSTTTGVVEVATVPSARSAPASGPPGTDELATIQLPQAEESVRVPVSRMDRLMGEVSELLVARMHSEEHRRELHRLQKLNQKWQREWRSVRTAYIRLARRMQHQPDAIPEEMVTLFRFLEENQRYLQETHRQLTIMGRDIAQYNAQLTMLTEQLQDDIGGMRLVPFDTLVGSFQRLVRDLARDTAKEVQLDVQGAMVEIDKAALDALKEPIMHLLRNAVDHGIEHAEQRQRVGKNHIGLVRIAVEQRGKEILIRVSDDGDGLDAGRIVRKALEVGLINAQDAADFTAEEAYSLIFHPGFTTAESVTPISGRGMGMDIVRIRVESLRGRVSVQSTPGRGTVFTLRLPVSLTRISCILLRAGGQDFAVPSVSVWRMLTLVHDQIFTAEGREMVLIEDRPVPVFALPPLLGIPSAPQSDEITLMVLASGEKAIAFVVDELFSEEELVLKPLGAEIANVRYVSGGALLGSGAVIIVLDPNDLIRGASGQPRLQFSSMTESASNTTTEPRKLKILIVDDSITTRTLEKHILETAGYEVQVATDGAEGWQRLGEYRPDLVISDVEMPRTNGLELTRLIKGDERTRHIPVILLTSLGKKEHQEEGLKAGANAYLVKSKFEQGDLLRVIRSVV